MKFKTYETIGSVLAWLSIISLAIGVMSVLVLHKQMPLFYRTGYMCRNVLVFGNFGYAKGQGR